MEEPIKKTPDVGGKALIDAGRRRDYTIAVSGTRGILDALYQILEDVRIVNVMDNIIEEIREKWGDAAAKKAKEYPYYNYGRKLYQNKYILPSGRDAQAKISACITELQKIWDDSVSKKLADNLKNYQFVVIRGGLMKLYSQINPFTNEIEMKSEDSEQLLKVFATIDMNLSSLAVLESKLDPQPMQDVFKVYDRLNKDEKAAFIRYYYFAEIINFVDPKLKIQTLNFLLSDLEIALKPSEVVGLFDRLKEGERESFLRLLIPLLFPKERRILVDLLQM